MNELTNLPSITCNHNVALNVMKKLGRVPVCFASSIGLILYNSSNTLSLFLRNLWNWPLTCYTYELYQTKKRKEGRKEGSYKSRTTYVDNPPQVHGGHGKTTSRRGNRQQKFKTLVDVVLFNYHDHGYGGYYLRVGCFRRRAGTFGSMRL